MDNSVENISLKDSICTVINNGDDDSVYNDHDQIIAESSKDRHTTDVSSLNRLTRSIQDKLDALKWGNQSMDNNNKSTHNHLFDDSDDDSTITNDDKLSSNKNIDENSTINSSSI